MGIYKVGLPAPAQRRYGIAQSGYGNYLLDQQRFFEQQREQMEQWAQTFGANSTNVPAEDIVKKQDDLKNNFKTDEVTKGTDWLGWAGAGADALTSLAGLGQLAMANKQYKLNKESFNYNKEMTNKQWLANVQNYNKTVYDQDKARSSFEGTQQGDYYNQWKQNV